MFQIQVHGDDWTSFYEQVPKENLPIEYGGKAGTVAEHWGETKYYKKNWNFTILLQVHFNAFENAPHYITNFV